MSTITVKDGTTIYYKDWGKGPVVTFSHGWPLTSDAWDGQMHFLAQNGFRVVAHDRRGHGRSSQAWSGNDMDGYADDLAAVIEALDLKDVTLVGHSTGGGEVTRYIGRHGTKRVAAAILIGAVPPILVKSASNPEGIPIEVFDGLRSGLTKDACGLEALTRFHFTALRRRLEITHRGLHENGKDERTVTTACLETCWTNWLITTDRFIRTDTRATHPGQENSSPPKAVYICADLSSCF